MASILPNPPPDQSFGRLWQFGECECYEIRYELRAGGMVVALERKPLEVLHQLLLRAGDTVRKEELLESVWPGVLVVDASLATAVSKLRKVLGEEEIVKTVPKVGYRISVPVRRMISRGEILTKPAGTALTSDADTRQAERFTIEPTHSRMVVKRRLVGWTPASVLLAGAVLGFIALRPGLKANRIPSPIAILPFQNIGSDASLNYLKSALPDEI